MTKTGFNILLNTMILIALFSCKKEDDAVMYIAFEQPQNFPNPTYNFDNKPFTQEKFELGKRLFYDGLLSKDGSTSCGTCHNQSHAFTHHGHQFSPGISGLEGTRNAQPIQNMAFMKEFTWDGAIRNLDLQPIVPIESEVEMGEKLENVLLKLQQEQSYLSDFNKAFDQKKGESNIINIRTLTEAFSQFMNALVSANSRYDQYIQNKEMDIPYSQNEKEGLAVFEQKCASCHPAPLFTDQTYRNNGLTTIDAVPNELGRARVSDEDNGKNAADYYKFKVPSLRNVWVTFPYMHDGRFANIDAVLEHYNAEVKEVNNLDPLLKKGNTLGIPLSTNDKTVLKAFLKSLTDETFISDDRFAEN